jgi:hypothetical protein
MEKRKVEAMDEMEESTHLHGCWGGGWKRIKGITGRKMVIFHSFAVHQLLTYNIDRVDISSNK